MLFRHVNVWGEYVVLSSDSPLVPDILAMTWSYFFNPQPIPRFLKFIEVRKLSCASDGFNTDLACDTNDILLKNRLKYDGLKVSATLNMQYRNSHNLGLGMAITTSRISEVACKFAHFKQ